MSDGTPGLSPAHITRSVDGTLMVQPDFFADDPECGVELLAATAPQPGKHTGERAQKDWERVQGILADYAAHLPLRAICRRHHCHHRVVTGLVQRNAGLVDTLKARAYKGLERVFMVLVERAEIECHLIPTTQLAINIGIVADKLRAAEMDLAGSQDDAKGAPTQAGAAAVEAWWRAKLEAMKRAKASILDVESRASDSKSDVISV